MSIVWRKVWRDLAHNKARTLLVVLSTAVGVFALGLVFGLSDVLRARMTQDHRSTNPAHVTFLGSVYGRDVVEVVSERPDVAQVEHQVSASFRWKLEGEPEWRNGELVAREDYTAQRMDLIRLLEGDWPSERSLALERQSARYFNVPLGTTIVVEFGRFERRLTVEGIVRMPGITPPQFGGDASFCATPETVAWLTGQDAFNRLNVRLAAFDRQIADEMAEQMKDRFQSMGLPAGGHFVTDPNVHPLQNMVDTMFIVLTVLGALALGLSAFLIVNTVSAIIAQQVWQIGVMKVVGATFGRVLRIYLTTVLIYGLLAVLIAVPLGAVGAHRMAGWLLDLINIEGGPFQVVPTAVAIQVVVGLTVPLLAALVPVVGGARITPHQAISSYGLGGRFGRGWLDRLIGRIRRLPRPMALSLRNTFRRKARVALTLLTLIVGGAMFIVVMSLGNSLNNTLEVIIGELGLDVWAVLDGPHRVEQLIEVTESVPGVVRAEVWDQAGASLALTSGEDRQISLLGVPSDSTLFNPNIVSGRDLLTEDGQAVLLNNKIALEEGIGVNDQIELTIGGRESTWTVVGLVLSVIENQEACYVPFDALSLAKGTVNRGTVVMVESQRHDEAGQQALIAQLRETYPRRGVDPIFFLSAHQIREQSQAQFDLITYLMLAMAVLAAVVGGFGLMGTMSINVVERRREIGVMRAIGATSAAIVAIFVGEGIVLGVLSWLLAAPLSYPGAQVFSRVVGQELLNVPLGFQYSTRGMLLWLALVVALSVLASFWPALRATRVSVREALAYE
jgi:putative ABC transport system permease protein